ncbi:helix-turn-helix domain-containing protein [Streptomyces sp. JNUCC 63]
MTTLLAKARELGDHSVADMARRTGISTSTLHRLAAGTKQPSLATLWTLHDAYGVRLDTLVHDAPHPTAPHPNPPLATTHPSPAPARTRLTPPPPAGPPPPTHSRPGERP